MRFVGIPLLLGTALVLSACPPTYPKCKGDENCQEKGEVCVQGFCRECATDKNCKPGFVCDQTRCVPKPECTGDSGCGEGKKCSSGKCVVAEVKKPEGSCTADEDCPSGENCKKGLCAKVEAPAKTCSFEPLRFDFNTYALTDAQTKILADYADCIRKGALRFTIEGHADERGTEEYNMVLSQRRASSVRNYLVSQGVAGGSLDTVGYGENKPAVDGHSEAAWATNRRVEFKKK
jgi:peptidoglycan-associated lipoprotein